MLAIADGALGFWKALEEAFPGVPHQQCWVHKTANILDKLPKRLREDAKNLAHEMYLAPTRKLALAAYGALRGPLPGSLPQGLGLPGEGRGGVVPLLRLPGRPVVHLRTTNPDRVDLRHGAPPDSPDQGLWLTNHDPDDGLQAGPRGRETLASSQQLLADHPA